MKRSASVFRSNDFGLSFIVHIKTLFKGGVRLIISSAGDGQALVMLNHLFNKATDKAVAMPFPAAALVVVYLIAGILFFRIDRNAGQTDAQWQLLFLLWMQKARLADTALRAANASRLFLQWRYDLWIPIVSVAILMSLLTIRYGARKEKNCGTHHVCLDQIPGSDGRVCQSSPIPMPLVYPCLVHHTRMVPKKHSFDYSYLMVGVPVGWRGSVGNFVSADLNTLPHPQRKRSSTWLDVRSADHLLRGDDEHGLQGKLDAYLESIVCHIKFSEKNAD